jgi:hypothetical protein
MKDIKKKNIAEPEKKFLRKIFGAVCEQGEWRIRTDDESTNSMGSSN